MEKKAKKTSMNMLLQAAGHGGCTVSEDGTLFIKPSRGQEIDFYLESRMHNLDDCSQEGEGGKLKDWLAEYLGTLTESGGEGDGEQKREMKDYIVLENLYYGMNCPSIMDIKLGSKLTNDLNVTKEKIKRMENISRNTTSFTLHFRVSGMILYNGEHDRIVLDKIFSDMDSLLVSIIDPKNMGEFYLKYNKMLGRMLTTENVKEGLLLYFKSFFCLNQLENDPDCCNILIYLLTIFIARLKALYKCLESYDLRMFSASLLFIYETDLERWDFDSLRNFNKLHFNDDIDDNSHGNDSCTTNISNNKNSAKNNISILKNDFDKNLHLSSLHLIDFAHSKFISKIGQDTNVLIGIKNLIHNFQTLLKNEKKKISNKSDTPLL